MFQLLQSPWAEHFDSLIKQAHLSLVIASPYVGRGPCNRITDIKSSPEEKNGLSILVLTDLSRNTLLSSATDVSALCDMSDAFRQMEIRFLPSIHAKVYVADDKLAVITSANMTNSGLLNNFEYGVKVDKRSLVRRIKADIIEYAALGTRIEPAKLKFLAQISSELKRIRAEVEVSVKSRLRKEFERRLSNFDEEIIRARAAGRARHAIFADAILYLLARRPLPTVELHPLIQSIHPELCDDSIDRVIDGRHFGKKWKHAVRTAQQNLKEAGKIELREGVWYLKRKSRSLGRRVR
ncbi:MAG: phospholipase D-like domain-containing protein [Candidatus Bathyarchaeia archaeon]